jgi:hypothetical protein
MTKTDQSEWPIWFHPQSNWSVSVSWSTVLNYYVRDEELKFSALDAIISSRLPKSACNQQLYTTVYTVGTHLGDGRVGRPRGDEGHGAGRGVVGHYRLLQTGKLYMYLKKKFLLEKENARKQRTIQTAVIRMHINFMRICIRILPYETLPIFSYKRYVNWKIYAFGIFSKSFVVTGTFWNTAQGRDDLKMFLKSSRVHILSRKESAHWARMNATTRGSLRGPRGSFRTRLQVWNKYDTSKTYTVPGTSGEIIAFP